MRNLPERHLVMRVDNQAGDLVLVIGHERFRKEAGQRQIGQRYACRDPLGRVFRTKPGEHVA